MVRRRREMRDDGTPISWGLEWDGVLAIAAMTLALSVVWQPTESAYEDGSANGRVVGWLVLAGCVAWRSRAAAVNRSVWRSTAFRLFVFSLAGLTLWFVLSAVVMGPRGHVRAAANAVWIWIGMTASWFVLHRLLASVRRQQTAMGAGVAIAALIALYGIYDWGVIQPETRRLYEADRLAVLRAQGIDPSEGNPQRRQFEDRLYSTEPLATFGLPNSLAGYLAPWFVLSAGLILESLTRHRGAWYWRGVLCCCTIAILFCLVLTKSRTAYLASGVGLAGLSLSDAGVRSTRRRAVTWGVALMGTMIVGVGWLVWRDPLVWRQAPLSLRYRLEYWSASLALVADRPWFGCGPGNFQAFYTRYMAPWSTETIADPHNYVIEALATGGIPAGFFFLLLVTAVGWSCWSHRGTTTASNGHAHPGEVGRSRWKFAGTCWVVILAATVWGRWDGGVGGIGLWWVLNLPWFFLAGLVGAAVAWGVAEAFSPDRPIPRRVVWCALAAWGVNALAAGAIGFWAVSQTAWLLLAIWWLPPEEAAAEPSVPREGRLAGFRSWHGVAAVMAFCLAGAAWWTGAAPVRRAERAMAAAQEAAVPEDAERWLEIAADADPWWSKPCKGLAQLHYQRAVMRGDRREAAAFLEAGEALVERERSSAPLYAQLGDWSAGLAERFEEPRWRQRAVALYRRAVALHPSNAFFHAQLAWYLEQSGAHGAAVVEADRALELDAHVPDPVLQLDRRRLREGRKRGAVSAERRMHQIRNEMTK